jgi:hypothetical protein
VTAPDGSRPDGSYTAHDAGDIQDITEETAKSAMQQPLLDAWNPANSLFAGLFGTFTSLGNLLGSIVSAITGAAGGLPELQAYSEQQLATVNDHTHQITELKQAYEQLILQGQAIAYPGPDIHYPSPNITGLLIIMIGAGAGGGAGRWDAFNGGAGGGGGGGGGETHFVIPASSLTKTNGVYDGIPIGIGYPGAGGVGSTNPGTGGGNTTIGTGANQVIAGGGVGGGSGYLNTGTQNVGGRGGDGGVGMIPGGRGGDGSGNTLMQSQPGGDSVSPYEMAGGGGGGAGGTGKNGGPSRGGAGGVAPGGAATAGSPGNPGSVPSTMLATGGGGGGAGSNTATGGAGAFPGGAGAGGGANNTSAGNGGNGAAGICFVVEKFT